MTEPVSNESEQVSNEEEAHVEIVTKEPIASKPVVAKIKDPRKIEAGKKLAAYNKKAKSSKKELEVARSASTVVDNGDAGDGGTTGFNITLTTVVAIIGLGLTALDLYLRHKKLMKKE